MSTAHDTAAEIESLARFVVGPGPQATLRRGFTIVRDEQGRPITSREAAVACKEFEVEFHDGTVPVTNKGTQP